MSEWLKAIKPQAATDKQCNTTTPVFTVSKSREGCSQQHQPHQLRSQETVIPWANVRMLNETQTAGFRTHRVFLRKSTDYNRDTRYVLAYDTGGCQIDDKTVKWNKLEWKGSVLIFTSDRFGYRNSYSNYFNAKQEFLRNNTNKLFKKCHPIRRPCQCHILFIRHLKFH